jgi:cytochrome c oxidase assembly protein subunit 15
MVYQRFAAFARGVLALNLVVILWGAFVRATGSGAGCGRHWPLCNGDVVPRAPAVETLVELTHRLTSGLALLAVLAMVIWAFRAYPRGHRVRGAAVLSLVFILVEALIGAGLVLLELVADNDSVARAYWMVGHLLNTFVLVAVLTLTAWYASGGRAVRVRGAGPLAWAIGAAMLAFLAVGATGAIAALGDTLFPSESLAQGLRDSFSERSHLLIRLRKIHPLLAIGTGAAIVGLGRFASRIHPSVAVRRAALVLMALYAAQFVVGMANVVMLAPVTLQLVHLLLADLVWIALVVLAAAALAEPAPDEKPAPAVPVAG